MKKVVALAALVLALLLGACGGDVPAAGVYHARIPNRSSGPDAPDALEVSLELKAGGEGSFITRTDATPVKWDVKDSRIVLHGKSGGVMTGEVVEDGMRIFFPGAGEVLFIKEKK